MRKSHALMVYTASLILLGVGFVLPLLMAIRGGFLNPDGGLSFAYLRGVFQNPIYVEGLLNSLRLALGTTLVATVIALPLAWISTRYHFFGKGVLTALLLVPMILPPFVGAIGFQQIFGVYGSLNSVLGWNIDWLGQGRWMGVVVLQALSLYPVLYLNLSASMANIDHAMEEAAQNLGANAWHRFRRITVPLMMPGWFAGGSIVFIWAFTELGTPLIMNYTRCASVQVFDALKEVGDNPFPFALVCVMLLLSVSLYSLSKLLLGRQHYAMQNKAGTSFEERRVRGPLACLLMLPFVLVISIALLPHVGVLLTSVASPGSWYQTLLPQEWTWQHYEEALGHSMTLSSIRNSLIFSCSAVAVNLLLGIGIAFVVVRSSLRGRHVLDTLAMLPLAVPGLVLASGYLALSSLISHSAWAKANEELFRFLDIRQNPALFLVLAYSVRRLPYMVRSAVAGLQQSSSSLEEAAANVGAAPSVSLRKITMPLITANLIAGALLAFSFSMLEVSDSLMLAQRQEFYPITKTIYELFQRIGGGVFLASALGVWAMLFLAVTLIGSSLLLGRKLGALFRV